MAPKILALDIETSPAVAHVWGLRDLNVGLNQIVADPEIIGVGFSWDGKPAKYISKWDQDELGGRAFMLGYIHDLLDQCDVAMGYNSQGFDIPWLNGEFARIGLTPPRPFKQIDLYRVVKKNMRFISHKLDYVAGALLGQNKLSTGGHQLWVDCMNGDEKARARMARYCKRDVMLLWPLLEVCRPWLGGQVNFALWSEQGAELACSKCGESEFLAPKGTAWTATRGYPQFWCKPAKGGCGGWTRDTRSDADTAVRSVGVTR
jgi:hypothetical protein